MRENVGAAFVAALLVAVGALASAALPARGEAAYCAGAELSPTATNGPRVAAATLCLINQVRRAYGLHPLRANGELRRLAASQVHDMVSWDYFADDRPPGLTPMALVSKTRYITHATKLSVGPEHRLGHGRIRDPGRHGGRLDRLSGAPRKHRHERISRSRRRGHPGRAGSLQTRTARRDVCDGVRRAQVLGLPRS